MTENDTTEWDDLPLAQHHVKALVESGITPEIARERGYRTIETGRVAELTELEPTAFGRRSCHAGLLVPSHGVTGGIVGHQLRPDAEVIHPKSGDVMKYLTPYGEHAMLDVPPRMIDKLRDVTTPLLITEGAKKADSAAARGLLCIALRGVDNWTSQQGTALEDWRDIQLLGRKVGICYDSDFATNKNVRGAAKRLSKYLTRRGADVVFVLLPSRESGQKVGLDDWLVDNPDGDPWSLAVDRLPDFAEEADPDKTPVLATDLDLADVFVARHGDRYRFVRETEKWLGFNGQKWDAEGGIVLARADYQDMIRTLAPYVEKTKDGEVIRVDQTPWMRQAGRITATLTQVSANRLVHTSVRALDVDPWLWNCPNGTYDLRRHTFLDHDPDHMITLGSNVAYDPDAECPQFLAFLEEVLPEPETRRFVQRVFGQAMIGTVTEHIFPVFHGVGRNGKGTLMRLVQHVFGSYYSGVSKTLLVVKAHEEHATVLASLHRKRLITAQEVAETDIFNASMIKELTGGDDITGRFMREDEFTFAPSHTMVLAANHLPKVSAKDDAFWRRLKKVPFVKVIEHPDDRVEQRMKKELPGILNWLLAGCKDYQEHGLGEPAAVVMATAGIRAESDPTSRFLGEYVEVTHDPQDTVLFSELYDHLYVTWHRNTRESTPLVARNLFGAEVAKALGIAPPRKVGKNKVVTFEGIRLLEGDTERSDRKSPLDGGPIDDGRSAMGPPDLGGSGDAKDADADAPSGGPTGGPTADPLTNADRTVRPGKADSADSADPLDGHKTSAVKTGGNPVTRSTTLPTFQANSPTQNEIGVGESAGSAGKTDVDILSTTDGDIWAAAYDRLAPADYAGTATESVGDGVLVFDIEGDEAQKVFTGGPEFLKIFGYQTGDQLRVTEDVREAVELITHAKKIVGHNIMGFDLMYFAVNHGLDIHQLAAEGRLYDTQLAEVMLNPPPFWMEPAQVPAKYKLDVLGKDKFDLGKSADLKDLVKKHGGHVAAKGKPGTDFAKIPNDDKEYVTYCAADVDLTTRIGRTHRPTKTQSDYIQREHRIAAIAAQVTMNGMKVDIDLLNERYRVGQERKAQTRQRLIDQYGFPATTKSGKESKGMSPAGRLAVERAFGDLDVELPRSQSGNGPATGKDVMDELIEQYADRPEVVELAQTVKTFNGERTVYGTALAHLHPDGRVHPSISMYQASGRWSVQNPGMTVFGKRGGRHIEREIFIADEGEVIIAADLSQVDARAIAAWSQDPAYMAMFEPGMDLHAEVAFQMFGDRGRRDDAKAVSHGSNYGLGFTRLAEKHGEELASKYLQTMAEQFPRLMEWKTEIRDEAKANNFILDNGWGRTLVIDPKNVYTQAPAYVGQSAARDIMMEGLLRLPRWVLPMLRVQVHDEIVLSVPEDRVDEIKAVVKDALSFPWRPFNGARGHAATVDIEADAGKAAKSWGEVYAK
jgi:DNA polymerase-1